MNKGKGLLAIVTVIIVVVIVIAVAAMAFVPRDVTVSVQGDGEASFKGTASLGGTDSLTIEIEPGEGMTAHVYLDGNLVESGVESYTYSMSMLDFSSHSIEIIFEPTQQVETYSLTVESNDGGTVSPAGVTEHEAGSTVTVSASPCEGFVISDILMDGTSIGTGPSVDIVMDGDHIVTVVFTTAAPGISYTITATAGSGGHITPSGEVTVAEGDNQTFTITANSSYRVSQVLVDGQAVTITNNSYTFENVTENHTISVTFRYSGGGGTVDPPATVSSIAVSGEYRTSYLAGEMFDKSGMVVTATYSNGRTAEVTGYTITPSGALSVDDSQVTVTYQGRSTTIPIQVANPETLVNLIIESGPTETHYFDDEKFDPSGIEVSGIYGNVTVPMDADQYTVTESDGWVTITYNDDTSIFSTIQVNRDLTITDDEELMLFARNVNENNKSYSDLTVTLGYDVDLTDEDWTPIGTHAGDYRQATNLTLNSNISAEDYVESSTLFRGTFDGDGHTITGLKIDSSNASTPSAAGFFGVLSGTVSDVTFTKAKVNHLSVPYLDMDSSPDGILESTYNGIGIVAGSLLDNGSITNVTVSDSSLSGNRYVGGIVGYTAGNVTVTNCTVRNVDLLAVPDNCRSDGKYDNGDKVGGIVGYVGYNGITLTHCRATDVTIKGYRDLGIIAGAIQPDRDNTYSNFTVSGINLITVDQTTYYYEDREANAGEVVGRVVDDEYSGNNDTVDGTVSIITVGTDLVIHSADELRKFAQSVNSGDTYSGKTVILAEDIDLLGENWTPIGLSANSKNKFQGTFDGMGHIISNMTIDSDEEATYTAAGFFGALNGTVRNLVFENADVSHLSAPAPGDKEGGTTNGTAVVAGSIYPNGTIDDVTVKNSSVSANRYVGGITGYAYGNITNCIVENVTLTATPDSLLDNTPNNGDKVGGIVGYWVKDIGHVVQGNTANNVKVTGYRDLGIIIGCGNFSDPSDVSRNTILGTNTVTVDRSVDAGDQEVNAGDFVGRFTGTSTQAGENVLNGTVTIMDNGTIQITSVQDFIDFADAVNNGSFDGDLVVLTTDLDFGNAEWTPVGTENNPFKGTFDGLGNTVSNLYVNMADENNAGLFGCINGGTVRNLNVDNADITGQDHVGVIAGSYVADIDNCHITGLVKVTGNYKVGGIIGYVYGSVSNCSIIVDDDSTVTGVYEAQNHEGDNVGGAIGYTGEGGEHYNHIHSNITIENLDVQGTRKVGGVVGFLQQAVTLTGSTYASGSVSSNATDDYARSNTITIGGIVGEFDGTEGEPVSTISNCYVAETTVSGPDSNHLGEICGGTRRVTENLVSTDNASSNVSLIANDSVRIGNANELVDFALRVNGGDSYSDVTVILTDNIDLAGIDWEPIGTSFDSGTRFAGVFDGRGFTISNLTIDTTDTAPTYSAAGLFGALDGTVRNLIIEDTMIKHLSAPASNSHSTSNGIAVVAGSLRAGAIIENVDVRDSTVEGNRYVAAIAGYCYGTVRDCNVTGCTLTAVPDMMLGDKYDNGDKVGGIVGYMGESGPSISGCSVSDTTATGYRNIGGIAGYSNRDTIANNTVSNVTLIQSSTNAYVYDAIGSKVIGSIVGNEIELNGINSGEAEIRCSFSINGVQNEYNYYVGSESYIEIGDADGLMFIMNNFDGILEQLKTHTNNNESTVYLWAWTIMLTDEIDFGDKTISSLPYPYGPLDGNNHMISNVNVVDDTNSKAGLFQSLGNVSDLYLSNIHVTSSVTDAWVGTLAGYGNGKWTNVSVNGFSVTTTAEGAYTGGLSGNMYFDKTDCSVANGTITGGKNTGGFAGYIASENGTTTITNCSVSNVSIDASERTSTIGSFTGKFNAVDAGELIINGCTVSNVTGDNVPSDRIYGENSGKPITIDGTPFSSNA